ncbi:MAG: hydrogenase expression/formation protein HypE [Ignavibacteria bacterium]|nr:hydrogenase expression/formation protein HypE [Ignavibacteria bacterium]
MNDTPDFSSGLSCPIPLDQYPHILLAHGGGGKLTQRLIAQMFLPQFSNPMLEPLHDGAIVTINGKRFAFSTDSFVVSPIFFPGGNIGELAVFGTVNDLAMCGAKPEFLSVGLIIEEGLPMDELWQITQSMRKAAERANVKLVTGDTKVVDRGKGDKLFINTSGVGTIPEEISISPRNARIGDSIIVSGPIGLHGIAIMSVREGLEFESPVLSDTAPLNHLVAKILAQTRGIHVLRDPTRGGIASALNEIAAASDVGIVLREDALPVTDEVQGACEILGLDPLYVANEGKFLSIVDPSDTTKVLEILRGNELGRGACVIGNVVEDHRRSVVMKTRIGGNRVVEMLSGEQLPRIC